MAWQRLWTGKRYACERVGGSPMLYCRVHQLSECIHEIERSLNFNLYNTDFLFVPRASRASTRGCSPACFLHCAIAPQGASETKHDLSSTKISYTQMSTRKVQSPSWTTHCSGHDAGFSPLTDKHVSLGRPQCSSTRVTHLVECTGLPARPTQQSCPLPLNLVLASPRTETCRTSRTVSWLHTTPTICLHPTRTHPLRNRALQRLLAPWHVGGGV